METVNQNITRLNHLLALYGLSNGDLLVLLNDGKNKDLTEKDIFSESIKISRLKRIDKIFNKGLSYYVDPSDRIQSTEESIFFRKNSFNASLSIGDRQVVNKYEEEKIEFDTLLKLSDIPKKRILPVFKLSDDPQKVATSIREIIYPNSNLDERGFLKSLINNLAKNNILVFEFVERHNKIYKANINGFFLLPDVIVLKWQKYKRREIFTLVHELGHYLLNEEEIDENVNFEIISTNLSDIEKWCNEFAFSFLIGNYQKSLSNLPLGSPTNDYHHSTIEGLVKNTYLSRLSLYTFLLYNNKISQGNYTSISKEIKIFIKNQENIEKAKFETAKIDAELNGKKLNMPQVKPIISPLYKQTLQIALYNGFLNEYEFCQRLYIKPEKLEAYLA